MAHSRPTRAHLALSFLGALALAGVTSASAAESALDFSNDMRKLWEDHVQWTRFYIVEAAADLAGKDASAQRLMQNQTHIGDAFKSFYGEDVGNQLTALLNDHISGAVEVLAAAQAGDQARLDSANAAWYANANDIAVFLSTAYPTSWPLERTQAEMKMHLDTTLEEATAHLKGDWAGSVAGYDHVHEHILGLADSLSSGVITAFPQQFDQSMMGQFPLRSAMRLLWEDHITWTRLYIIDAVSGLPGADATAQRLLRNQTDIGNAVKPFLGEEAGNRLTALLQDHINGAVEVLAAAKSGDTAKLEAAKTSWYANADDIATFLSAANPTSWPLETTKAEMKTHLDVTLEEATAYMTGDWAGSVEAYDRVHDHILHLADSLSSGILQAHPAQSMPAALPHTGRAEPARGPMWPAVLVGVLLVLGLVGRRWTARVSGPA